MKVILTENVENLGLVGDEKEVKDGFARNWLLPKKLAVYVNDPKAKEIIGKAKKEREKVAKEMDELKRLAGEISAKTIEIKVKSGNKGKLFGSVTQDEIAKELKLSKKILEMEPIKDVGEHNVVINLGHGIKANARVIVKSSQEKTKNK